MFPLVSPSKKIICEGRRSSVEHVDKNRCAETKGDKSEFIFKKEKSVVNSEHESHT